MRTKSRVMISGALLLAGCGDGTKPDALTPTTSTTSIQATTTTRRPALSSTTVVGVAAKCQTVGFTPSSEDAASDIEATGLSCDDAEAFVRIAGLRTSAGGPPAVDVDGFSCVRTRTEQEPLPHAFYECINGEKIVKFVRS